MKVRVDVMLKAGVLDPQGKAIGHTLSNLGFPGIGEVRVGRTIEIEMPNEKNEAEAKAKAKEMAEKILANLVIEDYRVTII